MDNKEENIEEQGISKKKKIMLYVIGIIVFVGLSFLTVFLLNKKNEKKEYLSIKCEDEDLSKDYKEGDTFECKLLGEKYNITVKKISGNKIELYTDKCLTTNGSDCPNNIKLVKGESLHLETPNAKEVKDMTIDWK